MLLLPLLATSFLLSASAPSRQEGASAPEVVIAEGVATHRESGSKIDYPRTMQVGNRTLELTGIGLRTKTIFGVRVYAYGLYVDMDAVGDDLMRWKGKSARQLADADDLYAKLLEDDVPKALRLVFARNVDADDVRSAFVDSLEPRLEQARKKEMGDGKPALDQFRGFFSLDKLRKGDELLFVSEPGGKLWTWVGKEAQDGLESKALVWALYDVFMGSKPIMRKGKDRLVDLVPGLLDARAEKAGARK